jgi:hypothetical protein
MLGTTKISVIDSFWICDVPGYSVESYMAQVVNLAVLLDSRAKPMFFYAWIIS